MKYKVRDGSVVMVRNPMEYYIIEHPKRGCFITFDDNTEKPRFSWTAMRTDDNVEAFTTERAVLRMFKRWKNDKLVQQCKLILIKNRRVYEDIPQPHLQPKPAVKVKKHKHSGRS